MDVLKELDVQTGVLERKRIAIVGYGSQGQAHAQNLRDGGFDVVVGLRAESAQRAAARKAGLAVAEIPEAVLDADVIMMLIPDERQPEVYAGAVAPHIRIGSYLGFAHGFAIHFRKLVPDAGINVFLCAPKGIGPMVRQQFQAGNGVPALIAVHQDPSGDTRDVALAYACGIGSGRAGILETTFREETETDLFSEQAVLCGGLSELIRAGYETLVEAGYAPEMAYFECLHEVKLIADLIHARGIAGMRRSISNTAAFGDITRGRRVVGPEMRAAMKQVLNEVQSGKFADEWMAAQANPNPTWRRKIDADAEHEIERVGQRLRLLMPWLQATT